MSESNAPLLHSKALANPFGRWAEQLSPYTEGSTVGVMATLISAFSGYVGPQVRVQMGAGSMPLSTWFVLVGQTGKGRKGATWRVTQPVITKAFKSWAASNIVAGVPATGLGLAAVLEESSGPLFVLEQEGDAFIDASKKGVKIGEYLRKAWDGAEIKHKTSQSDILIEDPHFGFVMHVQPSNWAKISGSRDATGGTFNRFAPLWVEQSKTVPLFGGPDATETFEEVAKLLRTAATNAKESTELVTVPDELAKRFEEHHRPAAEGLTNGSEELAQMAERALAYLVRFAALFSLADHRDEISEHDLDSALELVRYMVESVRYVIPQAGGESLASKIDQAVTAFGEITSGELFDIVGRNTKKHEIMAALAALPHIETTQGESTGGRRPTIYRLAEV